MKKNYALAKSKSIGVKKIEILGRRYVVNEAKLKKTKKMIIALGITAIFIAGTLLLTNIPQRIEHQIKAREVAVEASLNANEMLALNDLNVVPNSEDDWNNDYTKIENLTKNDVYGFYQYFGVEETIKVLNALGYNDWNQFLKKEGYLNEGHPDIKVWENYEETRLIKSDLESRKER